MAVCEDQWNVLNKSKDELMLWTEKREMIKWLMPYIGCDEGDDDTDKRRWRRRWLRQGGWKGWRRKRQWKSDYDRNDE